MIIKKLNNLSLCGIAYKKLNDSVKFLEENGVKDYELKDNELSICVCFNGDGNNAVYFNSKDSKTIVLHPIGDEACPSSNIEEIFEPNFWNCFQEKTRIDLEQYDLIIYEYC